MMSGYTRTVITPWGRETYQVLLDPEGRGWVARIVTLPNRLWARPDGREALKFRAATKEEADAAAARFIEEERILRGHRAAAPMDSGPLIERSPAIVQAQFHGAPRVVRRLLVRFGAQAPDHPGVTANLSETGLFVITEQPGPVGSEVSIDLRFPDASVFLKGEIVWLRAERQEGMSIGFGVRLPVRPHAYLAQLRALALQPAP